MHDETSHCHKNYFSVTDNSPTDSDQNVLLFELIDAAEVVCQHTTDRIQQGINRLLNDQVHLSNTINRLSDERSRIQSYLHNIYRHDNDAAWHSRQSNVKNQARLSKTSFESLSKWKVKRSMEYFDCPICLMEMTCGDHVTSVHGEHIFHTQCIKKWFNRSSLCPLCKLDCSSRQERQRCKK